MLAEPMLRAAVISSSSLVRAGLRAALDPGDGFELVGSYASFADLRADPASDVASDLANDLANDLSNDLANTCDVIVAEVDGDEAQTWAAPPGSGWPAVVLLIDADSAAVADWLADGITVLRADAPAALIASAARAAAAGLVATSKDLIAAALRAVPLLTRSDAAAAGHERLTARETEVLSKLAAGLGNKAIADALHISTHTAKFHVAQIIAKLSASSRAHAVAKALRAGLVVD